jgi:hypothetical protein
VTLKRASIVLLSSITIIWLFFAAQFAVTFELLGYGVHSSEHGWLGPTPRNPGRCAVDIGKVNSWECDDISVFTQHRLGCQLWLRIFGYAEA